jgi:hypothetical protein
MVLKETQIVERIHLAQDRVQGSDLVDTVMSTVKARNSLTACGTISVSKQQFCYVKSGKVSRFYKFSCALDFEILVLFAF